MKHIGALVFPKFELLDLCGPLQMFGMLKEDFSISLVAADKGPVPDVTPHPAPIQPARIAFSETWG